MERKKLIVNTIIALAGFCIIFLPGFSHLQKLRDEKEQLMRRIVLLEDKNDKIKEELARMKQDPVYVEQKAREKLGIIRKGEVIYRSSEE